MSTSTPISKENDETKKKVEKRLEKLHDEDRAIFNYEPITTGFDPNAGNGIYNPLDENVDNIVKELSDRIEKQSDDPIFTPQTDQTIATRQPSKNLVMRIVFGVILVVTIVQFAINVVVTPLVWVGFGLAFHSETIKIVWNLLLYFAIYATLGCFQVLLIVLIWGIIEKCKSNNKKYMRLI
jgi:hypothetical protein